MPNRRSAHHGAPWPLLLALLALAGCDAGSHKGSEPANHDGGDAPGSNHAARDESDGPGSSLSPTPGSFGSGAAGTGSAGVPMGPASGDRSGSDGAGAEPRIGEGSGDADAGAVDPIDIEPGQLTAGEWSDLADWSFWRDLHQGEPCSAFGNCEQSGPAAMMSEHWGFDTAGRFAVRVTSGGDPVIDAAVQLRDEEGTVLYAARTDSRGRAELFAGLFAESTGNYALSVEAAGEQVELTDLEPTGGEPIAIEFPVAHAPPPSLDLMFMVDTTGSMGDELSYIQAELGSVIEQVRDEIGSQLAVRLSVNFYRDRGDEYVVRDFPFTSEIDQALGQLSEQGAGGGGDTPEAVEEALDNAVTDHTWSEAATARLLFLVLDAPPHYDEGRLQSLHDSTRAAAERGVQIIPLAASGVDAPTEFLLRMLAIATNGTYTFLTDDSGIGNSHLEPTIGPYDVELLDELLVRVIRERL
jgi:hypothetical protein